MTAASLPRPGPPARAGRAAGDATISLVIPAYNAASTIARAVRSALAQSRPPDEILVVNDGSQDQTREAVLALQEKHPSIFLLDQVNQGVSGARNAGLKAASGTYVAFLDADDEWKPGHLASFFAYVREAGTVDVYSCGKHGERVAPSRGQERHTKHGYLQRVLECGLGFNTSGLVLRREAIGGQCFDTGFSTGEDVEFLLRLLFVQDLELHIQNVHSVTCHGSGRTGLSNVALDKPNAILEFCRRQKARLDPSCGDAQRALLDRIAARTELSILKSLLQHREFARLKAFSRRQVGESRSLRVRAWALLGLLLSFGRVSAGDRR